MIKRMAEKRLLELAKRFKAVAVTGPRQSGKTTLVKKVFPNKPYVSLENPDSRRFAIEDPRGFLDTYAGGAILDEVQRTPEIFSYLQEHLDDRRLKGQFILTGSNNFQLMESISQSLAGRIGYTHLLPFSLAELKNSKQLPKGDDALMIKGFYPPVYDQKIPSPDWCANYITSYIEKDVRQIKNITDLIVFERFLSLLAGRCSQELNNSVLANETGVDVKTIQSWIGILESSFIIFLLKPHYRNFRKTIVKRPKIYFYDTSIICSLLRISTESILRNHPHRGSIFENMVVSEIRKSKIHNHLESELFYWRDKAEHEVDLIIDDGQTLMPIEIKSSMTVPPDGFKNLSWWRNLSGAESSILLYGGDQYQNRKTGESTMNWRHFLTNFKIK